MAALDCLFIYFFFLGGGWIESWGGKINFWKSKDPKTCLTWLIFAIFSFWLGAMGGRAQSLGWGEFPLWCRRWWIAIRVLHRVSNWCCFWSQQISHWQQNKLFMLFDETWERALYMNIKAVPAYDQDWYIWCTSYTCIQGTTNLSHHIWLKLCHSSVTHISRLWPKLLVKENTTKVKFCSKCQNKIAVSNFSDENKTMGK